MQVESMHACTLEAFIQHPLASNPIPEYIPTT